MPNRALFCSTPTLRTCCHQAISWSSSLDGSRTASSQQSAKDKRNRSFDRSDLGKWRAALTPRQIADIGGVLDEFGVAAYDIDRDTPEIPEPEAGNRDPSPDRGQVTP